MIFFSNGRRHFCLHRRWSNERLVNEVLETVDVRISLEFSPVLIETVYCLQNRMDIAAKGKGEYFYVGTLDLPPQILQKRKNTVVNFKLNGKNPTAG